MDRSFQWKPPGKVATFGGGNPVAPDLSLRVFVLHPGITVLGNDPEWLKMTRSYPEISLNGVNTWVYSQGVIQKTQTCGSTLQFRSAAPCGWPERSASQSFQIRLGITMQNHPGSMSLKATHVFLVV